MTGDSNPDILQRWTRTSSAKWWWWMITL